MNSDVESFAAVMFIIGAFITTMVVLWVGTKLALRRGKQPSLGRSDAAFLDDARFTRLEQAVDAIAVEVERVAEAQRFSAKLMSERAADRALGGGRSAREHPTPH